MSAKGEAKASLHPMRASLTSLIVWGLIGAGIGGSFGAFVIEIRATTRWIGYDLTIFGRAAVQEIDMDSIDQVVWTWGLGFLSGFALLGASVAVIGRLLLAKSFR